MVLNNMHLLCLVFQYQRRLSIPITTNNRLISGKAFVFGRYTIITILTFMS